jgi:glycerol-3-phosphate dehydrogenase
MKPTELRAAALAALTHEPLDVLVIGGGIVGSGVARDAAMRGLRTGLVEQHDFAFGTSSRSSRLLHGGLRYLAQGRIGLVREASLEKTVLHRIAPHLAKPLAFIFPSYRGAGWPLWQLRIGVRAYDLLCGGRNLGKSSSLSRAQVLAQVPQLKADRLTGAARYFDALTNDARLVLDTLRSASIAGAALLNYLQFQAARRDNDLWVCQLMDHFTHHSCEVTARAVVNAAGPWAQALPHSQVRLRLTKGIHLVLPRDRLSISDALVITQGKRLLFVIPWGERLIVGTTDTDYRGPLDNVRAEPADIDYLLHSLSEFFPLSRLSRTDVISTWAGLRPLVANPDGSPSDISRAHEIHNPEPGWWDVAGGKLTIYRLMAEQTLDRIIARMPSGFQPKNLQPCQTAAKCLLPDNETETISGIVPPPFEQPSVDHFCRKEWALRLDDVMLRRSGWHYYCLDAAQKAQQVAGWMAQILGWSASQQNAELTRYRELTLPSPASPPDAHLL